MALYRNTLYLFADGLSLLTVAITENSTAKMDHYKRTFLRSDNAHQTQRADIIRSAFSLVFSCHHDKGLIMANSGQKNPRDRMYCSRAGRALDLQELPCITYICNGINWRRRGSFRILQ